jgi:hypothetical protein
LLLLSTPVLSGTPQWAGYEHRTSSVQLCAPSGNGRQRKPALRGVPLRTGVEEYIAHRMFPNQAYGLTPVACLEFLLLIVFPDITCIQSFFKQELRNETEIGSTSVGRGYAGR